MTGFNNFQFYSTGFNTSQFYSTGFNNFQFYSTGFTTTLSFDLGLPFFVLCVDAIGMVFRDRPVSKFFTRRRMEKEMEEEEEQKMDEQKFREFGTESDEDDDDAKEEDQQEEKEREVSKNKEKGGGKVEEEEQDDKWEEKEGNQFDYALINEYINNRRDEQLRRQEIPFGPEKKVDEKNTRYKFCKDYMEKNKEVKLVTPLHEVSTLRFRVANYLCAKRRSSFSMYLPKMST